MNHGHHTGTGRSLGRTPLEVGRRRAPQDDVGGTGAEWRRCCGGSAVANQKWACFQHLSTSSNLSANLFGWLDIKYVG